jgi:hypothetical protein
MSSDNQITDPSGNLGPTPDRDTAKFPDWTGEEASNRVLHIHCSFFHYGTDDKVHAASIVLSVAILFFCVIIAFIGAFSAGASWVNTVLGWAGNAFLLVAGTAIGRSLKNPGD